MRAARDSGRNWHLCQNVTVAWLHVASSREMASLFCLPHVALLISTVPVPARDISRPTGHVIDSLLTVPQLLSILPSIETNTHGISGHRTGSGHERALPAGRRLCRGARALAPPQSFILRGRSVLHILHELGGGSDPGTSTTVASTQ